MLEAKYRTIAQNARGLVEAVRTYELSCGEDVVDQRCQGKLSTIGRLAIVIGAALDEADDIQRTSWLEPGVVRDLRERHGLDDGVWDEIERLTRQYRH